MPSVPPRLCAPAHWVHALLWLVVAAPGVVGAKGTGVRHRIDVIGGNRAHVISADLGRSTLRVVDARDFGASALTAREFLEKSGAVAAWNGPFFDLDGKPMGLLVVDGVVRRELRPVDWGVFAVDAAGARIVHTDAWTTSAGVKQAIQVGPRLVVGGAPVSLKPQSARRTAICLKGPRSMEVLVSEGSLWAKDLATHLAGHGCRDALNLDGGPSSQLAYRTKDGIVEVAGGVPVPVALVLIDAEPAGEDGGQGCSH